MSLKIENLKARQILDSRGNPTVQAEVWCGNVCGTASVPSGASTGTYEAHELRDKIPEVYGGKGVEKAVNLINTELRERLSFRRLTDQREIDRLLIEADGTENKSRIGANAILAVSFAAAKCAANVLSLPLYRYIGGCGALQLPVPMLNVINGGRHADNGLDIQEFMIIPKREEFPKMLERSVKVYSKLRELLKADGESTAVGDEGGFAPSFPSHEKALDYLISAIEQSGFTAGEDFYIGLDVAANEFCNEADYLMPKSKTLYTADELNEYYNELLKKYPIVSIEDPFGENDWTAWNKFTKENKEMQIVGDDLFVTNKARLENGINTGAANAILIKPNQIGTLTETLECIERAKKAGYKIIVSHRSGETEDSTIADIAVAVCADMIKSGAPARSERTAKYNRLLKIYEEIR